MRHTNLISGDRDKLEMIDSIFDAFTKDELKDLLGQELIVNKLKGIPKRMGILESLIFDNLNQDVTITRLETEITTLRGELTLAKSDMLTVIRYINDRFSGYNSTKTEFDNLKNRYGIY